MGKDLELSRLCDAYGALLTEHRREMVREFYDYDLSLSEIAENFGITRQAVMIGLKQAKTQLENYETKLGNVARSDKLERDLTELIDFIPETATDARIKIEQMISELR